MAASIGDWPIYDYFFGGPNWEMEQMRKCHMAVSHLFGGWLVVGGGWWLVVVGGGWSGLKLRLA